jgi:hypothetical protein
LLYIGGTLKFGQKRHYSISKIYVSTQDSIDNGQKNWGIPKEMAHFEVQYGADNHDTIKAKHTLQVKQSLNLVLVIICLNFLLIPN